MIQPTTNSQSQSDILAFHGLNGIHGAQGELIFVDMSLKENPPRQGSHLCCGNFIPNAPKQHQYGLDCHCGVCCMPGPFQASVQQRWAFKECPVTTNTISPAPVSTPKLLRAIPPFWPPSRPRPPHIKPISNQVKGRAKTTLDGDIKVETLVKGQVAISD